MPRDKIVIPLRGVTQLRTAGKRMGKSGRRIGKSLKYLSGGALVNKKTGKRLSKKQVAAVRRRGKKPLAPPPIPVSPYKKKKKRKSKRAIRNAPPKSFGPIIAKPPPKPRKRKKAKLTEAQKGAQCLAAKARRNRLARERYARKKAARG